MTYHCPICKRPLFSADEACSGSFLEADHPALVKAVAGEPNIEIVDENVRERVREQPPYDIGEDPS